ncbi:hypothetical protein XI01_03285 [Bradyrhizobium sp. CCBAU 21360]|nr:hypothetical protein [Bradyrhizobium sp. CCBAU 21360]
MLLLAIAPPGTRSNVLSSDIAHLSLNLAFRVRARSRYTQLTATINVRSSLETGPVVRAFRLSLIGFPQGTASMIDPHQLARDRTSRLHASSGYRSKVKRMDEVGGLALFFADHVVAIAATG